MRPRRNTEEDWSDSEVLFVVVRRSTTQTRRTFFLFQSFCCHHAQQRFEKKIKKKSCEKKDILDCACCRCCCSCIARRTRSGGPTTTNRRKHRQSWLDDFVDKTQHFSNSFLCCTKFRALNPNSSKASFAREGRREEGKEASKEEQNIYRIIMALIVGDDFQHILRVLNTNVDGREKVREREFVFLVRVARVCARKGLRLKFSSPAFTFFSPRFLPCERDPKPAHLCLNGRRCLEKQTRE